MHWNPVDVKVLVFFPLCARPIPYFFCSRQPCHTLPLIVGMDYLSVAAYDDLAASHLVFLKSRVRDFNLLVASFSF